MSSEILKEPGTKNSNMIEDVIKGSQSSTSDSSVEAQSLATRRRPDGGPFTVLYMGPVHSTVASLYGVHRKSDITLHGCQKSDNYVSS